MGKSNFYNEMNIIVLGYMRILMFNLSYVLGTLYKMYYKID